MKKICFLMNSLGVGGAERLAYILHNELDVYKVIVLRNDLKDNYGIPNHKIVALDLYNKSPNIHPLKKFLILIKSAMVLKELKNKLGCDIVISHAEPSNVINAMSKTSKKEKTVLVIHDDYYQTINHGMSIYGRYFYNYIGLKMLKKADLAIAVSKQAKVNFCRVSKFPEERVKVIYNPINIEEILRMSKESLDEYEELLHHTNIINIGRLTKQKGQWYLIRIFKKLKESMPEVKLLILGEGELKNSLVQMSINLGLRTFLRGKDKFSTDYDVYFLGRQENPFKFLVKSDLFVSTSLWEAFPFAIVEAMACGVPVIYTDCESGPREILSVSNQTYNKKLDVPEFAEYGVLMPVFDAKFKSHTEPMDKIENIWVDTIKTALFNKEIRLKYSTSGLERARQFDIDKTIIEWRKALETL